jgi:MFS family permease
MIDKGQLRRLVISTFLGTALEAFDFIVYALLTPVAFNPLFFPRLSPATATIASLSVFAVGIVARPVGGIFFGHIGDRLGRKVTMILTLSLMGIATAAIGLVPTYDTIGVAAPISLAVLRFLQGFAYGGENSSAPVFVAESSPPNRRGLYTSWCASGVPAGIALSGVTVDAVARLSNENMLAWGWRIPFLLSVIAVAIGLYIRLKIEESPAFLASIETAKPFRLPLVEVLCKYKMPALIATIISLGQTATFYFTAVFGLSYALQTLHLPKPAALLGISLGNSIGIFATPFFGLVSDIVGRRLVMGLCFIVAAFYVPLVFFPLLQTGEWTNIVMAMAIPGMLLQPSSLGTSYIFFAELFSDARVRFTGVALGKQFGNVLGAGLLPVIAASLVVSNSGDLTYVNALFVAINLIAVIATYMYHETKDVRM